MKVAEFPLDDFARDLASAGCFITSGPVIVQIRSNMPSLAHGLYTLYQHHPCTLNESFADVTVCVWERKGRWPGGKSRGHFVIRGEISQKIDPKLATAYFEWCLNNVIPRFFLHVLMIHAGVVERDGYALILPAPSGSGKSTLTAGLVHRGWRLLSDEIAMVGLNDGLIHPLARPVCLKSNSIDVIRRFAPDAIFGPEMYEPKENRRIAHMAAPADSVARMLEPAQPRALVFPRYVENATACFTPMTKGKAFLRIMHGSMNYLILGAAGFTAATRLLDACHCYEFAYSNLDEAVAAFAAFPGDLTTNGNVQSTVGSP